MEVVSQLKSGLAALEAAVGQNRYEDGESFGNPEEDFDDKAVDVGDYDSKATPASDGEKKKMFAAMMRKKLG